MAHDRLTAHRALLERVGLSNRRQALEGGNCCGLEVVVKFYIVCRPDALGVSLHVLTHVNKTANTTYYGEEHFT